MFKTNRFYSSGSVVGRACSGGLFAGDTRLKSRPVQNKFAFSVKCAKIPKLSALTPESVLKNSKKCSSINHKQKVSGNSAI